MTTKDILFSRKDLELELDKVRSEEASIDAELREYFQTISAPKSLINKRISFDSVDLISNIKKIESFAPMIEVITEDSKKLVNQIDECHQLSDRLSVMVRRLDLMQMHAQQALVCTEDVMNLKECKIRLLSAIEQRNLPLAVQYIRQVHHIDSKAAKTSDDYETILQAEVETRNLVRDALNEAMAGSEISAVVGLCPLLQTLGLEVEARDNLLSFLESTVFIAVSADAAVSDNVTDIATGYAQTLSNVFNSTYLIFQKYLSLVIQGTENSLGDILFIRKLYGKCEKESGLVLKRYMKYRNIKQMISTIKSPASSGIQGMTITSSSLSSSNALASTKVSSSELHVILDELSLLVQYCCLYAKYIKSVCAGAESRIRSVNASSPDIITILNHTSSSSSLSSSKVTVFHGATEFDKMIDELINRYYMEGEHHLLRTAAKNCLPKNIDDKHDLSSLDESFFVFQRCGLRAIATNNIHAACAILHLISDLLVSDIAQQAREYITKATNRLNSIFYEHMNRYIKSNMNINGADGGSLSIGFKSAMSLASSITGSSSNNAANNNNMNINSSGSSSSGGNDDDYVEDEDDPYRIAQYVEAFNAVERCIRYTERLTKDIMASADNIYSSSSSSNGSSSNGLSSPTPSSLGSKATKSLHVDMDADKIRLCKESFDQSKATFQEVMRQGLEKIVSYADSMMKETLLFVLGKHGPLGGVRFDLPDDRFDEQPAISLLPRTLVTPFETIVNFSSYGLSDANKDLVLTLLAEACVGRLEHFINQTTFRFAGALKFEECVRSITNIFTKASTSMIRSRFARLREILVVITSDSADSLATDNFSHLTPSEIEAFIALRIDAQPSTS